MKQLTITAIAILFSATTILAERNSFRDRSENWLQNESTEETSANLRGAIDDANATPQGQLSVPIGAFPAFFIFVFAGMYLIRKKTHNL
jgi:hypothetical protein